MTNHSEPASDGVSDSSPGQPASPGPAAVAPRPAAPSGIRAWWSRLADWCSAREPIRRAQEREATLNPTRKSLLHQARAFADSADWLVDSTAEPPLAPVLTLYRQAVLLLLAAEVGSAPPEAVVLEGRPGLGDLAGGEAKLSRLQARLATPSACLTEDVSQREQAPLIELCRTFVRRWLEREQTEPLRRAIRTRRFRKTAVALLIVFTTVVGAGLIRLATAPTDLAAGRSWRTSSKFPYDWPSRLMFHTAWEANPWVELDLGAAKVVSKIVVRNRTDCCLDRADPLILESSTDDRDWRPMARHDGLFTTWEPAFAPVNARFLRFRVPRTSALHFERVNVY